MCIVCLCVIYLKKNPRQWSLPLFQYLVKEVSSPSSQKKEKKKMERLSEKINHDNVLVFLIFHFMSSLTSSGGIM